MTLLTRSAQIARTCVESYWWREVMDSFATRLRTDRENAGLTVRQLADETDISFSYITKIETGRSGKGISPDIVTKLASRLRADVLEYLYLSDVVPPPLKTLLSNPQSRDFVRSILSSPLKKSDWNRLQVAVNETRASYSVPQIRNPNATTKSAG